MRGRIATGYGFPSVDVSEKVTLTTELFLWVSVVFTAVFLPLISIAGGGNDYTNHKEEYKQSNESVASSL